jgi:hypothetical protein
VIRRRRAGVDSILAAFHVPRADRPAAGGVAAVRGTP